MTDRVVLACSGGLDTSVAIGWIGAESRAEVVALAGDVGQGGENLGLASRYDHALATYDAGDQFDQRDARGFIELWGKPSKVWAARERRMSVGAGRSA